MSYEETDRDLRARWGDKFFKPQLKTKIGFEDSLRRLIDLCMTCEPEDFPKNVHRLFYSLPEPWRDEELKEAVPDCQEDFEVVTPVLCCGIPVKPEAMLPQTKVVTETDWHRLFNAILNCCNRRDLLIAQTKREVIPAREEIPS